MGGRDAICGECGHSFGMHSHYHEEYNVFTHIGRCKWVVFGGGRAWPCNCKKFVSMLAEDADQAENMSK